MIANQSGRSAHHTREWLAWAAAVLVLAGCGTPKAADQEGPQAPAKSSAKQPSQDSSAGSGDRPSKAASGNPAQKPSVAEAEDPATDQALPDGSGLQAAAKFVTNKLGMKLAYIPPGQFLMGSPEDEEDREDDEKQHHVKLTNGFYLGVFEVTQAEFEAVLGRNPSWYSRNGSRREEVAGQDTDGFPVDNVSWYDCIEFCNELSRREGLTAYYKLVGIERDHRCIVSATVTVPGGPGYRLPTEAEWEYACRAGTTAPFHFGSLLNGEHANVKGNNYPYGTTVKGKYLGRPTTIGTYPPNQFGLHDMHGNVSEWCADWFAEDYYARSPSNDPIGPTSGTSRVLRGGSWDSYARYNRAAYRNTDSPDGRFFLNDGFRVSRTP